LFHLHIINDKYIMTHFALSFLSVVSFPGVQTEIGLCSGRKNTFIIPPSLL